MGSIRQRPDDEAQRAEVNVALIVSTINIGFGIYLKARVAH
jgi:hypothetical protein